MEPQDHAFASLFAAHYRTVVGFIFRRVSDWALAEDLTSETFARAWEKHQTGTDISLSWLFKTARNLIGNEYQRRDYEKSRVERIALVEQSRAASDSRESGDIELHIAMSQLRPLDALVLQLTYWDGLSAPEAAQYLDCTTAALWVRLTRARASLRKLLADPATTLPVPLAQGGDVNG